MQEYMTFITNHPLLVMAWVGICGALFYTFIQSKISGVSQLTSAKATQLINKEDALVIDIRNSDEFSRGHIVGAKNLPLAQIQNKSLTSIENKKQIPIILVCESGMRTTAAAKVLVAESFEKVFTLQGGMNQWRSDKLPVSKK